MATTTAWTRYATGLRRRHRATAVERLAAALGIRLIPLSRDGSVTGKYGQCPRCNDFAGFGLDPDGRTWRSLCGCLAPTGKAMLYEDLVVLRLDEPAGSA